MQASSPSASLPHFPFVAVAGQQSFKLALILAAINPQIGGVLVSGPRGSAKSTLARGLADILPVVDGMPSPFVTLPLGASEDMLLGTLNLQQVLNERQVAFQPGLLAKADKGVLYVDEVNLLPDNLVDVLLDVSASGTNIIERDGISHRHPARFILLGTMNADEGELRPQLQDRFGLSVELTNQYSIVERMEIVRLREAFDAAPEAFIANYATAQADLSDGIAKAKALLAGVQCADALRELIAERCHLAQVDGLRADIVWLRAAMAHCAFAGRQDVQEEDVLAVEELVLAHRRQARTDVPPSPPSPPPFSRPPDRQSSTGDGNSTSQSTSGDWGQMAPVQQMTEDLAKLGLPPIGQSLQAKKIAAPQHNQDKAYRPSKGHSGQGLRKTARDSQKINWYTSLVKRLTDVNIGADSLWSARSLVYQKQKTGQPVLHLVLLDTSASVLEQRLFAKAKGLVLQLAEEAYLARQSLTVMGFGNQRVETLLPKRRAPKSLRRLLDQLPAAGGTPLREMLQQALQYQQQQLRLEPGIQLKTYLITDGRTTQPFQDLRLLGEVTVLDMEQASIKRGKTRQIADTLCARYFSLPAMLAATR